MLIVASREHVNWCQQQAIRVHTANMIADINIQVTPQTSYQEQDGIQTVRFAAKSNQIMRSPHQHNHNHQTDALRMRLKPIIVEKGDEVKDCRETLANTQIQTIRSTKMTRPRKRRKMFTQIERTNLGCRQLKAIYWVLLILANLSYHSSESATNSGEFEELIRLASYRVRKLANNLASFRIRTHRRQIPVDRQSEPALPAPNCRPKEPGRGRQEALLLLRHPGRL